MSGVYQHRIFDIRYTDTDTDTVGETEAISTESMLARDGTSRNQLLQTQTQTQTKDDDDAIGL